MNGDNGVVVQIYIFQTISQGKPTKIRNACARNEMIQKSIFTSFKSGHNHSAGAEAKDESYQTDELKRHLSYFTFISQFDLIYYISPG